jgi:hypothetical protein
VPCSGFKLALGPFGARHARVRLAAAALALGAGHTALAVADPCVHDAPLPLEVRVRTGSRPASAPSIGADGTVYVGTAEGYLHAYAPDGTYRWGYTLRGAVVGDLALSGRIVLVPTTRRIDAIRLDGTGLWSFESPVTIRAGLVADGAGRFFFASEDGRLFSISERGALMHIPGKGGFSSAPVRLGSVVGVARTDGTALLAHGFRTRRVDLGGRARELFACPNAELCALIEREVVGFSSGNPAFRYPALRAASGAGRLAIVSERRSLDVYRGSEHLYSVPLRGDASAAPLVDGRGRVFVPLESGALVAFSEAGRALGCTKLADSPLGPPVFDADRRRVWVTAREGVLAALEVN